MTARLHVYRDPEDGAWIADILDPPAGEEWSGSYWTREQATEHGLIKLRAITAAASPDSRLEYLEAVADGMPDDHDWSQYSKGGATD